MTEVMPRVLVAALLLCWLTVPAWAGRDGGGYYSAKRVAILRANVQKYAWAAQQRDGYVKAAQQWVQMPDEELWRLVPGQNLPRCIDVTMTRGKSAGCLVCGEAVFKYGNYPYKVDPLALPWKITCPSCGTVFPTNDFGAFYRSALDEHGLFDASRGDRSLLYNAQHPDANDPLHTWGVDDGWGYQDPNGNLYRFIGYYTWQLWRTVCAGLNALAWAYLYTGEPIYAHKAGVLLDRIADVYPDMDWAPYAKLGWYHSDGGSGRGKIEGRIWETGVVKGFARAYDMVADGLDDCPELLEFLARMAQQYELPRPKGTLDELYRNIEEGILRTGAQAIISQQIRGNEGMHQSAMAAVAMAFGRDPEMTQWLDWIFQPDGGAIPGVIIGAIDRDGVGSEGAPGYSLSWATNIGELADMLADFPAYDKNDIYRDYPTFKKTFTAGYNLVVLGLATPNIGDSGATGSLGKVACDPNFIARGYRYLRDPEIALAAWRANGDSVAALKPDIWAEDPEAYIREIEAIGQAAPPAGARGGFNRTGYGLMALERGYGKEGVGLWLYYGRNWGHGHLDRLNIGLYGFGLDLMPDLGYPEYATAWPQRLEWTDNTLSHNTVVVDREPQATNWGGQSVFFKTLPGISAGEVSSPNVYPQCDVYARTVALIHVGERDAYALDIFRVRGGSEHLLSIHSVPGEPTLDRLMPVPQQQGTYAGPDVPFGARKSKEVPLGFSWLYQVARDAAPPAQWLADWQVPEGYRGAKAADDLHLACHHLTACDEVALAYGDPPQNKPGNPRNLRYLLARRTGPAGLASTFVSLLEPYRTEPLIASVQRLDTGPDAEGFDSVAARVQLADGATDYLVSCTGGELVEGPDGLSFDCRLGFIRLREGRVERAAMIWGTTLALGDFRLQTDRPALTGTVVRMDRDLEGDGRIWVDTELPSDDTLVGEQISIANDGARDATYTIARVEREGQATMLSLGAVSFVRDFANRQDYSAGYVYDFEEGAAFTIPGHAWVERTGPDQADIRSSRGARVELAQ